ncbi:MAG: c-type cytochrome [Terracidiphilus sp.]|jgi:mono/diheme cytochrome c family protein
MRSVAVPAALTSCLVFYCAQASIEAASRPAAPVVGVAQAAGGATKDSAGNDSAGGKSYAANCAICHGDHLEGNLPAFPPLLGVEHHLTAAQITEIIQKGKDRMPGNPDLKGEELASLLRYLQSADEAASKPANGAESGQAAVLAEAGGALFQQNCAFCHGRDAMGGESGPDLTRSKIVRADVNGDKISEVVRNGRPEKKMPAFNFSAPELQSLVAFIHAQITLAESVKGGRKGVEVADLQTGNVDAGKRYFDGQGGCVKCHSATGDLAGVATRFEGLALEERMLYPRGAKSEVTVTLHSGTVITGTLAYVDEFTVAMRDGDGNYHSWPVSMVKYKVKAPVDAHAELLGKYSDADIHNLMAYLQTMH